MRKRVLVIALTTAVILATLGLVAETRAQDDGNDIDDLQATAQAHEATAQAQQTEITALEDRVAALETAVAQASPVTDGPTEVPAGDASPVAVDVLYQADATGGFDDWTGPADWLYRDGQLVNTGTENQSVILAPYQPSVSDYAVEAEIRLVRCTVGDEGTFGVVARATEEGAYYRAGHYCYPVIPWREVHIWAVAPEDADVDSLVEEDFTVDAEWHTYRLEVRGTTFQLFIDGELVAETGDVRYVSAGQVGLWSSMLPIEVRSFRVLAL